ncbi:hypothetical protein BT96DRAFT_926034, partial [Gymnopus androsaceus JB14]
MIMLLPNKLIDCILDNLSSDKNALWNCSLVESLGCLFSASHFRKDRAGWPFEEISHL